MIDKRLDPLNFGIKLDTPRAMRCIAPVASMTKNHETVSQVMYGEEVLYFGNNIFQTKHDGYVGLADVKGFSDDFTPTHFVNTPLTWGLKATKVQAFAQQPFYFGAKVKTVSFEGTYALLENGLFLPASHLSPIDTHLNALDTARLFINTPYLWGGRSPHGIDCSGLTQIAYAFAGINLPRDSDMQEQCGEAVELNAILQAGDLVFWKGHVGMMLDSIMMIHANGFHMKTVIEPLREANERITHQTGAGLRAIRRFLQLR